MASKAKARATAGSACLLCGIRPGETRDVGKDDPGTPCPLCESDVTETRCLSPWRLVLSLGTAATVIRGLIYALVPIDDTFDRLAVFVAGTIVLLLALTIAALAARPS